MAFNANNSFVKGSDLMVFDASGHSIAFATSHSLSISGDATDVSSKDHGKWGAQDVQKLSYEISTENLFTVNGFANLFDAMVSREEMVIYFGLKDQSEFDMNGLVTAAGEYINKAEGVYSGSTEYTGNAAHWSADSATPIYKATVVITSLEANADNDSNATYSATMQGKGAIIRGTWNGTSFRPANT